MSRIAAFFSALAVLTLTLPVLSETPHAREFTCDKAERWHVSDEELKRILDRHAEWLQAMPMTVVYGDTPLDQATAADPRRANLCNAVISEVTSRRDLSGVNLARARLQGAYLEGAILDGANLFRADLNGAVLSYVKLDCIEGVEGYLQCADLAKAWLNGANMVLANLQGANLANAELDGALANGANFRGADLSGAHLRNAKLQSLLSLGRKKGCLYKNCSIDPKSSILDDADLSGADLRGADISGAFLRNTNLQDALLIETDLSHADLRGADLSGASLRRAKLRGALLSSATIKEAKLGEADLSDADLSGADLSGAFLRRAKLQETILQRTDLSYANLEHAWLLDTDITGARLNGANITGALYEPVGAPDERYVYDIIGLKNVFFRWGKQRGLVQLRSMFVDASLRDAERVVTSTLEHMRTKYRLGQKLDPRYGPEGNSFQWEERPDRSALKYIAGLFSKVFFGWTTDYGDVYGRPLLLLLALLFLMWPFYAFTILRARGNSKSGSGIVRVVPKGAIRFRNNGDVSLSADDTASWLRSHWLHALGFGFYYSLLSAFNLGWREFNIGNWLSRMQHTEFTLRARGWVRFFSGLQSVVSLYFIAIWALTFFGRPFG